MRQNLKEADSSGVAEPVQVTLRTAMKSKDLREEFILLKKMLPFLRNTASKVVLGHSHRVLGPGGMFL